MLFFLSIVSVLGSAFATCPGNQLYETLFVGLWTGAPWPEGYDVNIGITEFIYVTHDSNFSLFRDGNRPSTALQAYANSTTQPTNVGGLMANIGAGLANGSVLANYSFSRVGGSLVLVGYLLENDVGAQRGTIMVDSTHPYVSIVGRIFPSADLFVGLDTFSLCNATTSTWASTISTPASPFSAGIRESLNGFKFEGAFVVPSRPVSQIKCNTTGQTVFCNPTTPNIATIGNPKVGNFGFSTTTPQCAGRKTYTVSFVTFWGPPNFQLNQAVSTNGFNPTIVNKDFVFFTNATVITDSIGTSFAQMAGGHITQRAFANNIINPQFNEFKSTEHSQRSRSGSSAYMVGTLDGIIVDGAHTFVDYVNTFRRDAIQRHTPYFAFAAGQTNTLCHSGALNGIGGDIFVYGTGNYTYNTATDLPEVSGSPFPFSRASCGGSLTEFCFGSQLMPPIGYIVASPTSTSCTATGGKMFRVTFRGLWTRADFPIGFPSKQFFSPIVGVSHSSQYTLFSSGRNASVGLKNVAETGNVTTLLSELKTARDNAGTVLSFAASLDGPTVSGTGMMTLDIYVDATHPYVSLVSMLAPSPDWFAGVTINTCASTTSLGSNYKVMLNAYDAGTDNGASFSSPNQATIPQMPVSALQCGNGVFCSGMKPVQNVGMVTLASQTVVAGAGFSLPLCFGIKSYRLTMTSTWAANADVGRPTNARMETLIALSMSRSDVLFNTTRLVSAQLGNWAANASSANVDALLTFLNNQTGVLVAVANKGSSNSDGSDSLSIDITVDPVHTWIGTISRFSDSPDWFLSIQEDVCSSGSYRTPFAVNVSTVYDAGVRNGSTFGGVTSPESVGVSLKACGAAFCASGSFPSVATIQVGAQPIQSFAPTGTPTTTSPSKVPTSAPSKYPASSSPTSIPTRNPTTNPTKNPTSNPTQNPTQNPTKNPTSIPTSYPVTTAPTSVPLTSAPSATPTKNPTKNPTSNPTNNPTKNPTSNPSTNPTSNPTKNPSSNPTGNPTKNPTSNPTAKPVTPFTSPCNLENKFIDIQVGTTATDRVRAYATHNTTHYTIVMSGPTNAWFGVGFGTSGKMSGSEALIYSGSGVAKLYSLQASSLGGGEMELSKQPQLLTTATSAGARRVCVVGKRADAPSTLNTEKTKAIWAKGANLTLLRHTARGGPVDIAIVNGTTIGSSAFRTSAYFCMLIGLASLVLGM